MIGLLGGAIGGKKPIKGLIGGSGKKKGALVKKERPQMTAFAEKMEAKKAAAVPSQRMVPELGPSKKTTETTPQSILKKIGLLIKFEKVRNLLDTDKRKSEKKQEVEDDRSEAEQKKENWAKKLGTGVAAKALAPVTSIWDNILNAIGAIVLGKIALWAIDNPEMFASIVKGIQKIANVAVDIFIGAIDILAGVLTFGYDLVNGFEDWTTNDDAQKAANKFGNWAPAITAFLNTAILLGGALADEAIRKSRENLQDRGGDTGKGKGTGTKPTKVKPRTRSSRSTQTRRASKLARKRFAQRYGPDAARRRFGRQVPGRQAPIQSKIFGRGGIQKSITRFGIKLNPGMVKNFKFLAKMAKGIKVPIIGPILIGVGSIMGGDPLGKALFKTLGAVGGGILGSLIPIPFLGTVIGEAIGLFAGELLYEGFMGQGWGAAGQIIVDTFKGFVTGAGKFGKALLDWTFGGGLLGLLKNVGGGLLKFGKYMLGGGFIMDVLKGAAGFGKMLLGWLFGGGLWNLLKATGGGLLALANWIFIKDGGILGKLLGAIGGGAQIISKWMGGVFTRFNKDFPSFPVPDWKMPIIGWIPRVPGLQRVLGIALGWIPFFKKWMEDGKLKAFPDFSMLIPGFGFPFFMAHLGKSLFPDSFFANLPSGISDFKWGGDEKENKDTKKPELDKEISEDKSTSSTSPSLIEKDAHASGAPQIKDSVVDKSSGLVPDGGGAGGASVAGGSAGGGGGGGAVLAGSQAPMISPGGSPSPASAGGAKMMANVGGKSVDKFYKVQLHAFLYKQG